jgi:hypothetical protein
VLIDRHMPVFDVADRDATALDAPPIERVRRRATSTSRAPPVIRTLYAARGVSSLICRSSRHRGSSRRRSMTLPADAR